MLMIALGIACVLLAPSRTLIEPVHARLFRVGTDSKQIPGELVNNKKIGLITINTTEAFEPKIITKCAGQ